TLLRSSFPDLHRALQPLTPASHSCNAHQQAICLITCLGVSGSHATQWSCPFPIQPTGRKFRVGGFIVNAETHIGVRGIVSILEIRHIRSLRPRRFGAMQPAWQDTSCVLFATQRAAAVDFLALVRHLEDALAPAAKSLGFFLSFAYTRYPFLNSVHLVAPRRVSPARRQSQHERIRADSTVARYPHPHAAFALVHWRMNRGLHVNPLQNSLPTSNSTLSAIWK
ncbi:hypothetical protein B0H14DRAFT_718081, partial [Mycena olivaceomarginata]